MPADPQDLSAVQRCLRGETAVFSELLGRYKLRVFSYLLRVVRNPSDAEDLAQETFLKAYSKLGSYDPAHPFLTWLFRIAHNCAVDLLRRRRPEEFSLEDEEEPLETADPAADPERRAESASTRESVDHALAGLPAPYREALILRHREGLDYRSMAGVLGVPEGTVKIRIFRGRDLLRKRLSEMGLAGA
ncbi:MAG: RNA polymerase sigma factor [Elusimicrobiota bacterium]